MVKESELESTAESPLVEDQRSCTGLCFTVCSTHRAHTHTERARTHASTHARTHARPHARANAHTHTHTHTHTQLEIMASGFSGLTVYRDPDAIQVCECVCVCVCVCVGYVCVCMCE